MKSHELKVIANKKSTRVGRGIAAGQGKTAGRGTKGQSSRSGGKRKAGFEGGQTPIMRRLPKKRGFRTLAKPMQVVYTSQIDALGAKVTNQTLFEAGLVEDQYSSVKVVVKGEVTKKHDVVLSNASKGAIEQIEKAGGKFTATSAEMRPKQTKSE
jgi:large subunit ribosomal protein L15